MALVPDCPIERFPESFWVLWCGRAGIMWPVTEHNGAQAWLCFASADDAQYYGESTEGINHFRVGEYSLDQARELFRRSARLVLWGLPPVTRDQPVFIELPAKKPRIYG